MTRATTHATAETTGCTKGVPVRRELLTRDPEVQARAGLDEPTVERYAELMRDGAEFPALTVFDDGDKLWLADGFTRDAAAERAGLDTFPCDVRQGTHRDAVLFSISANARHGLPFTKAEKRRAVEKLLRDAEWSRWSDTEIARLAGVGKSFVHKMRRRLQPEAVGTPRLARRREQVYELRPAAQGSGAKRDAPPDYVADWLYYLVRFDVRQFLRWQQIVAKRTDRIVLAEAVDLVMRETQQQPSGRAAR